MVSGRTCSMTANLQDEIDPEHLEKELGYRDHLVQEQSAKQDANDMDTQDSPGKALLDTVSDILSNSAQSMKDFVAGNKTSTEENGIAGPEEKTLLQAMEEKYTQPTKDADNGSGETTNAESLEERTLLQSMGERIVDSVKTVKDAVNGSSDNITTDSDETGEASILVHSILD